MAEKRIDIGAIRHNAEEINKTTELIAVVKADAYGHGALKVANAINNYVCGFAVASAEEADILVNGGIKKDIIIFGYTPPYEHAPNVIRSFSNPAELNSFCNGERIAVKIDTGMNRYGADPSEAEKIINFLTAKNALHSVYTHLRCPEDVSLTEKQYELFEKCAVPEDCKKHVAASRGLNCEREYKNGTVRCGIALYGGIKPFRQAMSIYGNVQCVRKVYAGNGVGYGNDVIKHDTLVAVTDIGYADGYRRTKKDRYVFLGGKRRRVLAVCMDCTIVEADFSVKTGDCAEFLGSNISADELSSAWDTDAYELFTTFGRNLKTVYYDTEEISNG